MPAEPDRVAQAAGEDRAFAAVGGQAHDGRVLGVALGARVAGRADAQVELPVRAQAERAVGMLAGVGEIVGEQPQGTDVAVRQQVTDEQLAHGCYVDFAAADRHAMQVRSAQDRLLGVGAPVAVLVLHRDQLAGIALADVEGAVGADGEDARLGDGGERADRESRGHAGRAARHRHGRGRYTLPPSDARSGFCWARTDTAMPLVSSAAASFSSMRPAQATTVPSWPAIVPSARPGT